MPNALRLVEGFAEPEFAARTGLSTAAIGPVLAGLRDRGLMEQPRPGCWRATGLGFRFLNDLLTPFVMHSGKSRSANLGNYVSIQ